MRLWVNDELSGPLDDRSVSGWSKCFRGESANLKLVKN